MSDVVKHLRAFVNDLPSEVEELTPEKALTLGMIKAQRAAKKTVMNKRNELMKNYDANIFKVMKISNGVIEIPEENLKYYGEDLVKAVSGIPNATIKAV